MSPQGAYYVLEAFYAISQGPKCGKNSQDLVAHISRCRRARSCPGLVDFACNAVATLASNRTASTQTGAVTWDPHDHRVLWLSLGWGSGRKRISDHAGSPVAPPALNGTCVLGVLFHPRVREHSHTCLPPWSAYCGYYSAERVSHGGCPRLPPHS